MKIFNFGLKIEPGKYKYKDEFFDKLVDKFSPQKSTPYTVEFTEAEIDRCDAVVFDNARRLDFIVGDLEKIEKRSLRSESQEEKAALLKAQEALEKETLLCDIEFTQGEKEFLKLLSLVTLRPCVGKTADFDINVLIKEVIQGAGLILFFTIGKKEVRIWTLEKGEPVLEAAGKIHSDLKRGFIKAEVTKAGDLDKFFNMAEARAKGFVKTVDRDYIVEDKDIIEIKFNV